MPEIGGLYISSANSIGALEALRKTGRLHKFPIITTDLFPELVPFLHDGSVMATIYQCPELQGSIAIQAMYRYLMDGVTPPHEMFSLDKIDKAKVGSYAASLTQNIC